MKKALFILLGSLLASLAVAQDYFQGQVQSRSGSFRYFHVDIEDPESVLTITMDEIDQGVADLYVRYNAQPTKSEWDIRPGLVSGDEVVVLNDSTTPKLKTGRYWIGISARKSYTVILTIQSERKVSARPGMGSIPYSGGTTFRVWAPNAQRVHVAGSFNGWNGNAAELVSEGNGNWSLDLRNAVPGQEYKYVIRNGTQTLWQNDPRAKWLTNSVGNTKIHNSAFNWQNNITMPGWSDMVIYQMHIGTFNDVPGGRPGTFDTAISRLDSLQDLGVNAIKILPPHEFPGDFSWGYNPSYPFSVEEAYGGPDALKRFVDAAAARGIVVLIDLVHNHWGPSDMNLWRFDGWSQGNWGGIYFYNDTRAITSWGDTRPDYGRPEVRQYIRDNVLQWLEEFRISGVRWDSALSTRTTNWGDNGDGWSLMQWINNEVNARQPWKLMVAEDLQNNPWITKTTGAGGAGFDAQWSPGFVHPLRPLMTTPSDSGRNMNDLVGALTGNYNGNPFERVIYTESHDEVANGRSRVPQEIDPGNPGSYWARKRSTLGAITTLTAPGIPMLFQGQEILEDEYFRDTDPIDWNKANTYAGIRLMYKDLVTLRRNLGGKTAGLGGPHINVFHVNHGAKVVAYHRWKNGGVGDDVIVIMNWSNTPFNQYQIGLPHGGNWKVAFNSDWNGYSGDFGNTFSPDIVASTSPRDGLAYSGGFNLGPYSALVIVRP